ncbi:phosphoglycerate mutase-like protein [Hypoxylon sp. FL1857]|nr:phosphoglycerate mutase-like protein [Hypoxylon sp. FL1857]
MDMKGTSRMAPTIDIIRHAQSYHNVAGSHFRDPPITDVGVRQCEFLREVYPYGNKVTHIVSSPLRRTIETTLLAIKPIVKDDVKITLLPELQEVNATPSSIGTKKQRLQYLFKGVQALDMSLLINKWYRKGSDSPYAPSVEKVEERAMMARRWLRMLARMAVKAGKEDAHIVAVTHGEFAHWLTEDFVGVGFRRNSGWSVCEFRSYQFTDLDAPDTEDVPLVETQESLKDRGFGPDNALASSSTPDMKLLKKIASTTVQQHARFLEGCELEIKEELEAQAVALGKEGEDVWVDVDDEDEDDEDDKENQKP